MMSSMLFFNGDNAWLKPTRTRSCSLPPASSLRPSCSLLFRCEVSPTGGGGFIVYPEGNRRHYNVVNLNFEDPPADHVYNCTCGFCSRCRIPYRHVIAAAKGVKNLLSRVVLIRLGRAFCRFASCFFLPCGCMFGWTLEA